MRMRLAPEERLAYQLEDWLDTGRLAEPVILTRFSSSLASASPPVRRVCRQNRVLVLGIPVVTARPDAEGRAAPCRLKSRHVLTITS